jgi:hypothetical protein
VTRQRAAKVLILLLALALVVWEATIAGAKVARAIIRAETAEQSLQTALTFRGRGRIINP